MALNSKQLIQRLARKNELKARGTLLMALPDKHQLKFNIHKDAKTFMEAIKKRFSGNKETKKKLISQLKILRESLSQEDINFKFLRSLHTEWRNHTLIWRNKTDLEEQSLDDLFNSLKIYQAELDNDDLKQIDDDDLEEMDLKLQIAMLTVRARRFLQRTGRNLGANGPTSIGFDMSKVECYNCHKKGTLQESVGHLRTQEGISETDESLPASPIYDRYHSREGYHAVPPPYTGTFMPRKPDLVFHDAPNVHETVHTAFNVKLSPTKPDKELSHRPSAPIIKDWVSDSDDDSEAELPHNVPSFVQPTEQVKTHRPFVKTIEHSIPAVNHKTVIPKPKSHGNSRNRKACFVCKSLTHLIKDWNMSYLSDFKEINEGYVAFGGNPKGGKITRKGKIRTDTKCIVLSPEFKLPDENQVLLRVPRENNIYNVDLKNIVPSGDLTCLFAKATLDESNRWHRRLGHINFKTMNKLVKGNLVRGLPLKLVKDTKCIVLSPEFKLPDENQVLLRVPRENNMYNVDLKNIVPSIDLTCLFAKATLYESNRWHRRLGHINFKTMNKLVKDPLCKFDGKANKGVLVGYFNTDGDAAFKVKEPEFEGRKPESKVYVSPSSSAQTKKHDDETKREAKGKSHVQLSIGYRNLSAEFEDFSNNSINEINVVDSLIPAVRQISTNSTNTFRAAALEDITYSDNEEDVGAEADFTNLEINITGSPIPTTKVHKDHPMTQIISDLSLATQTRSMKRVVTDQEPKRVHQALKDPSWIEAIQEELLQFKMQKVWVLVDLPNGKRAIGHTQEEGIDYEEVFAPVARIEAIRFLLAYASFMGSMVYQMDVISAFLYRTIKEEVYVCQPPGFEDPDYPNKVYKVVKALYGLHQAPKAWYDTLANYLLENGFQRGKIDQTLFIEKQKGDIFLVQVYVDDIIFGSTNKDLCKAFEKLMKDKFQMSSMGELTFFLDIQVKQKPDGIFISHDKYVAEILRNFGLTDGKSSSTPIDTEKPLIKDPDGKDVDMHTYRSMIGSLMYLTSSRPDIMFAVCACAHFQVTPKVSHLHAVKSIFRYLKGKPHLGLWYLKDSPFNSVAYSDSDYDGASLDRKSITGGCQFLGCRLISWQCKKQTVVATSSTKAKYVAAVAQSSMKSLKINLHVTNILSVG
nr:hypothetical protein [Tanacetum cinerariifolium]